MVVTQIAARDVLLNRLKKIFSADIFGALYPDYVLPKVLLGFPVNDAPFYVAVDEIVTNVTSGKGSTCGEVQVSFTLNVWVFARKTSLQDASNTAMVYADAIFSAVCADQTLKGTVDYSSPNIKQGATAADADRKYIATEIIEIDCKTWSKCPHAMREAINEGDI